MSSYPDDKFSSSNREEVLELLAEYTEKLKRYLEWEASRSAKLRAFASVSLSVSAAIAISVAIYFLTAGPEVQTELKGLLESGIPIFAILLAFFAFLGVSVRSLGLSSRGFSNEIKRPHEIEVVSKILERIVVRAVQMTDHSRRKMDFKLDIRIAEAEAVLSRFSRKQD